MNELLAVDNLQVRYRTRHGYLKAVDGVSFGIAPGETLGLVGESGSGKSSVGKTIIRLIEPCAGTIRFAGLDITHMPARKLRPHRRRFQMIFQDPGGSLDPRQRIGRIIAEPLEFHRIGNRAGRQDRVRNLMANVGLDSELADRLPHEFSGGQRQRVAIARALALDPNLIVCDEPVSALDVSLQAQIVNLLARLQRERAVAYLFISHDLSVVQHLADRVAVMYLAKIVEVGPRAELWRRPAHPYTRALIDAVPTMERATGRVANKQLVAGEPPSPYSPPKGCRFHSRCPHAAEPCRTVEPTLREVSPGHAVACHFDFSTPDHAKAAAVASILSA
jgi:oligopeptide/dipeptide ABC transporter ATP-binding protein